MREGGLERRPAQEERSGAQGLEGEDGIGQRRMVGKRLAKEAATAVVASADGLEQPGRTHQLEQLSSLGPGLDIRLGMLALRQDLASDHDLAARRGRVELLR